MHQDHMSAKGTDCLRLNLASVPERSEAELFEWVG